MFRLLAVFAIVWIGLSAPLAAKEIPLDERGLALAFCYNDNHFAQQSMDAFMFAGEGKALPERVEDGYLMADEIVFTPDQIIASVDTKYSERTFWIDREDLTYRFEITRRGTTRSEVGTCRFKDWDKPEISESLRYDYNDSAEAEQAWSHAPASFPRESGVYIKNPEGRNPYFAFVDWERKHIYELRARHSDREEALLSDLSHKRFGFDWDGTPMSWSAEFEYVDKELAAVYERTPNACHCPSMKKTSYADVAAIEDYAFVLSRLREYAAHFGTDITTLGE